MTTKLTIAIDYRPCTIGPLSGVARQVRALIDYIRSRDDMELILVSDGPIDHPDRQYAIFPASGTSLSKTTRPFRRIWFEQIFLPKLIKQRCVDMYYGTVNCGLPLLAPRSCCLIQWVHDYFHISMKGVYPSLKSALFYKLYYWPSFLVTAYKAHKLHVISDFIESESHRLFPITKNKTHRIYNFVDSMKSIEPEPILGLPSEYWLTVGSFEPRKNLRFLTNVWFKLPREERKPLVVISNQLVWPDFLRQCEDFHVFSNISDGQLITAYRSACCYWQPSLGEGFGLPVVESLMQGTPVAVSSGGALEEVSPPEMPRFSPCNEASLTAVMKSVYKSPPSIDCVRLHEFLDQFSKPAFQNNLNALFDDILQSKST